MLIDYLTGRAVAWAALIGKPHMIACIALLCALLVIDLAIRGWRLSWSRRAVMGAFTTLTIFHVNFLLVPLIWLLSEKVKALYALVGIPSIPTNCLSVPGYAPSPISVLVTGKPSLRTSSVTSAEASPRMARRSSSDM